MPDETRPTTPPRPGETTRSIPREQVARRAYELWQDEGRPDGRQEEHWRLAWQDLLLRRLERGE